MDRCELQRAGDLLWWLRRNGFTQHLLGDAVRPTAMVFSRLTGTYIDLAHIRGEDRTEVARIPNDETANIWTPRFVVWHYYGPVVDALTVLKTLPTPAEPHAPTTRYAPPREGVPRPLSVPDEERETTIVRPAGTLD
jgi:hypothetical protein